MDLVCFLGDPLNGFCVVSDGSLCSSVLIPREITSPDVSLKTEP